MIKTFKTDFINFCMATGDLGTGSLFSKKQHPFRKLFQYGFPQGSEVISENLFYGKWRRELFR
jgi:hypothetical protein